MSAKVLSKLFWLFAFLCFLLIVQTGDEPQTKTSIPIEQHIPVPPQEQHNKVQHPDFYDAYKGVFNIKNDDEKLDAIKQLLLIAEKNNISDTRVIQSLNLIAAGIHESRWHMIYALKFFQAAQRSRFDERVEHKIEAIKSYLSKVEAERSLNSEYIATKDTGPAKSFRGKILVAYVFVDDGIKTRWSNKTKQRTQVVMQSVQQWQKARANEYRVNDIEFINKTFIASRNPMLTSPKSVSFTSSHKEITDYVEFVANSLGAKSIGEFIAKQVTDANAEQGVVILHSNLNERSFASRCGYTHKQRIYKNGRFEYKLISQCKDEYVMLMEQVERNRWDKMHYAQAHEMMHVFGAADLYNIKSASDYAVTDIMNFQSKNLTQSKVEPITAFAIGWQKQPPEAPFEILER
jgi:hypothetical protein